MQRHARPLWPGHCQRYDLFSATRGHIMRPPSGQSLRPLPVLFSSAVPLSATPGYISCLSGLQGKVCGQFQKPCRRDHCHAGLQRPSGLQGKCPRPLSANHTIQCHVRLNCLSCLQAKVHGHCQRITQFSATSG